MKGTLILAAAAALWEPAAAEPVRPDQAAFREIYKELVETDTSLSSGSCTVAAERMATHLVEAGFPATDLHLLFPPDHPTQGNLVVVMPGTDKSKRALLLVAHIDVVEARREDWERDPFTLIEEGGFFYGRGTFDDKGMAAIFVDSLVRLRRSGYKPPRSIKLALTCGEETSANFNGVQWLVANHRSLIDAEFAINEGASGRLDETGRHISFAIQAGEKTVQNYRLETTNPGGHSSTPVKDNAIVNLASALTRLNQHDFPIMPNEAVRTFFARSAALTPGPLGVDMRAVGDGTADETAYSRIAAADPVWNAMLRTTCVVTQLEAGHARNALPQRAQANVNCRLLPGLSAHSVRAELEEIVADSRVNVTLAHEPYPTASAPRLTPAILGPIEEIAARMWPGVPVIPTMATGATDGRFLSATGIPTYGMTGMFHDPRGPGHHGLNERLRVRSLYEARDFLHEVIQRYAESG